MRSDPGRVGNVDGVIPLQPGRVQCLRIDHRINDNVHIIGLQNTIRRAAGIIAAAIVIQNRY